jgi:hypothetical protein
MDRRLLCRTADRTASVMLGKVAALVDIDEHIEIG